MFSTKDLEAVLDDARRELSTPDLSSRRMNFKAVSQTLPAVQAVLAGPATRVWTVRPDDRRARHLLGQAVDQRRFVVYGNFVSYDSDGFGASRVAPLLTTRVAYDDSTLTASALEVAAPNYDLIDFLTNQGAEFDRTTILKPGRASARRIVDAPYEHDRLGIAPIESTAVGAYLDHHTNPALLGNRILKLFATGSEHGTLLTHGAHAPSSAAADDGSEIAAVSRRLDPDQAEAVRLAASGLDLVVNGPPGSGKSTVIAAIATAVAESGARVLVTSTEASALDVTRRRLRGSGEQVQRSTIVGTLAEIAAITPATIGVPDYAILIIDEASRMTLSEALPLLGRATSVVIIGDARQLPPNQGGTTVLDRATALGLRRIQLRFHYRSFDRTLITPSNIMAYDLALRTVPRPDRSKTAGVKMVVCSGAATKETDAGVVNTHEAKAIVARLVQHASNADKRSIAVITANSAQADHIRVELTRALAVAGLEDRALTPDPEEPFFVRNTGAVQGEERDVVLISLVYRPNTAARNPFGVFDRAAAIERLNVVMSRARREMIVHLSFRTSDFDRTRPLSPGAIAYMLTRKILDALLMTDYRQTTPSKIDSLARKVSKVSDNLGVVYGFRADRASHYDVGLVVRDESREGAHWDAIVRQLRDTGWSIVEATHLDVQRDPDRVARAIMARLSEPKPRLNQPRVLS